jgi:LPS-assembly protein
MPVAEMSVRLIRVAFALLAMTPPWEASAQTAPGPDPRVPELPAPPLRPAPQLVAPPPASPPRVAAPVAAQPATEQGVIFLRADRVEGTAEKFIEATGKVELRTRRETVLADSLHYDFITDVITAKGDVLIRRGIDWVTGPELRFKRDSETGVFVSPRFYIGENASRGSAKEIRFTGPEHYEASVAQYTTCVAPRDDWFIRMDELEVDRTRMVGTGHDATLYFLGAPIAYTPWIEFPLSSERKSGFLAPVLGSSGNRGFEYAQPYYFNLAPNYDATIVPRIMSKRGLQLNGQFRYLFENANGEDTGEYMPHDRVLGEDRWSIASRHTQNLAPGLVGYWNFNKVSDPTYFADLADRVGLTSQTTLPREGGVTYASGPWQLLFRGQAFQTLFDPTAPPGPPPYNRIPQLFASLQEVDWHGLTFAGTAEYADFHNPDPLLVTGQRTYAYPSVAWKRQGSAWFVSASTGVHARYYNLNNTTADRATQTYAIPISSIDAGLIYERDTNFLGKDVVQTLEPRAFYVYVPFRDQKKAPIFDTAIDDYNFAQLFSTNRYLGNDRIGDANQVTLAVTSRLLDPGSGAERLRVAVGERFYFSDQGVTLNEVPRSASTSDVLVGAEGKLTDAWALGTLWQYNFDQSQTERLDMALRYTPAPGKAFNASWRYARQSVNSSGLPAPLKQFDLSTQWPLSEAWTLLGRWNYSLVDSKTLEAIGGIEYNGGCWVLRLVVHRLTTTTQSASTSIYVQLELNGLARIGTNPLDLLRRSVPGYQRANDPTLSPRDRDDQFQEF